MPTLMEHTEPSRPESRGERLKRLRDLKGLTQEVLAARSGVSKSYISEVERGKIRNPGSDILHEIARNLNVTPSYLRGVDESPQDDYDSARRQLAAAAHQILATSPVAVPRVSDLRQLGVGKDVRKIAGSTVEGWDYLPPEPWREREGNLIGVTLRQPQTWMRWGFEDPPRPGQTIIFDSRYPESEQEVVGVIEDIENFSLHRVRKTPDGWVLLVGDGEIGPQLDRVRLLGVVVRYGDPYRPLKVPLELL